MNIKTRIHTYITLHSIFKGTYKVHTYNKYPTGVKNRRSQESILDPLGYFLCSNQSIFFVVVECKSVK